MILQKELQNEFSDDSKGVPYYLDMIFILFLYNIHYLSIFYIKYKNLV